MAAASATQSRSFLDTAWARLIALLIAIGGIALFYDRNSERVDAWFQGRAGAGDSAYEQCLAERLAAVENMAAEANFTAKQRELAEIRAAETCRNRTAQ